VCREEAVRDDTRSCGNRGRERHPASP
jgi:hypothetical protein